MIPRALTARSAPVAAQWALSALGKHPAMEELAFGRELSVLIIVSVFFKNLPFYFKSFQVAYEEINLLLNFLNFPK